VKSGIREERVIGLPYKLEGRFLHQRKTSRVHTAWRENNKNNSLDSSHKKPRKKKNALLPPLWFNRVLI